MYVERQGSEFAQTCDQWHSIGQIWHKMAIHHIEMQRWDASCLQSANLRCEIPEITLE